MKLVPTGRTEADRLLLDETLLTWEERAILALRGLYRGAGYALYRMSKFEEYDLYAGNKDFLISDNVITFTDVGGKLMALKPDVTLSIVRATRDREQGVEKLCYDEKVYRPAEHGGHFRELSQTGLECLGDVGDAEIAEVLSLALRSLALLSAGKCRLNISHLGVLRAMLDRAGLSGEARQRALVCMARKSAHELRALCTAAGVDTKAAADLEALLGLSGPAAAVLPRLRELGCDAGDLALLERAAGPLGDGAALDFSIVSDLNYYNGVVFQGYVDGASTAVLSGGQYNRLMLKLGRRNRAIGFAVYLDRLLPAAPEEVDP